MYSLSSQETLEEFIINPRPYLLPPHPLLPFKVCIVGPPSSGKSTIAQLIANEYNALVSFGTPECFILLFTYVCMFIRDCSSNLHNSVV